MFREVDDDGSVVRTFGEIPPIAGLEEAAMFQQMVEMELGLGPWLCLEGEDGASDHIVLARHTPPHLEAYTLDGERLWERSFDWMIPPGFEVNVEEGSHRWITDPDRGEHFASALLPWAGDTLLVQITHRRRVEREDGEGTQLVRTTESLLVAAADGALVGRLAAFPPVAGGGEGRFFVTESDPFPHVLVLEVATGG